MSGTGSIISRVRHNQFSKTFFISLWVSLLLLPFAGPRIAAIFFVIVFFSVLLIRLIKKTASAEPVSTVYSRIQSMSGSIYSGRYSGFMLLIAAVASAAAPFALTSYYLDILIMACIYMLLALGLNVIVGYTGLLHLGFAGSYAIGAYTYALLNTHFGINFWLCLPVSALASSAAGLLLAIPALRLRGDYLAIVTLGFGEIIRIVLNNWDSVTKGPNGISGIAAPSIAGISLGNLHLYYYVVLAIILIALFVIKRVEVSRTGRAWMAIREDEIAASSMGINITRYKIYAFVFGSLWAGVAGQLFAAKMQFVSPESFTFMESVFILCMVILGGLGNTYGVLFGAFIIAIMPEALRGIDSYRMLIVGIGLVALMIFRPQGITGGARRCR